MNTWVVLLRGINVGGAHKLPMKTLKGWLENAGYRNVRSYIQSGNIVLESKTEPGPDIGQLVEANAGFKPEVLVLEKQAFLEAMANNPWPQAEGKTVHLSFCAGSPSPDIDRIEQLKSGSEAFHYANKVFYLYAPDGIGRSKLAAKTESCLGVPATSRNLNTVKQIRELLQP